jgi:hypothetical protein
MTMRWPFTRRRERFQQGVIAAHQIGEALRALGVSYEASHGPETPRARYRRIVREVEGFFTRAGNDPDVNLRYILAHEWCRVWLEGWLSQAAGRPVEVGRQFDVEATIERQLGVR